MEKKRKPKNSIKQETDLSMWWWLTHRGISAVFVSISLFVVLVRVGVSVHPYSGASDPPKFGDFEAQRHWMEITTNLPVTEWYRNSSVNDLTYWGLDYPPLTAYQSYVHGRFIKFFNPESVALYSSRGYESYIGKLLMRWTVLMSDVLIFFPAVLYYVFAYYSSNGLKQRNDVAWHIAMMLLNPCLILIDHGHFQYNCISLGLTVAAVAAILSDRDVVGSILYCLALNHKQMSAYFAPAFFGYLLGKCLKRQYPIFEVVKLGLAVVGTFALVWWPYLQYEAFLEVLSRLAPFERGIYEDYVANFWCTSSVLIKWKRLFTTERLRLLSLTATICACIPSMVQLIWVPTKGTFLYGLLSSSLSFYLFSYQVHEKSILLPLLPASFLALEEPLMLWWLMHHAMLSMFPLLNRDKLVLPYIALHGLFTLIFYAPGGRQDAKKTPTLLVILRAFLCASSFGLHVIYLTMTPPRKYPFLFEAIIMLFCFLQFVSIFVFSNTKQWTLTRHSKSKDKVKKHV
ncbi:hypothetical protein Leryth_013704 [Lithospermum erythrorhizon]|nr:hypothetical protein Leryth_013704 [Lithospermum erythrorhizon]